jgi:hypothetical protein
MFERLNRLRADRPQLRPAQMSCSGPIRTGETKAAASLTQVLPAGPRWSYGNE